MPILNWMPLARARFQHAVRCRCPGSQRALPDSEDPSREAWLGRREPRETGSDRGRPQVVPTRSCARCKDRGALPLPPTSAGTTQVKGWSRPVEVASECKGRGRSFHSHSPRRAGGRSPSTPPIPAAHGGPLARYPTLLPFSTLGGTGTRCPPLPFPRGLEDGGPDPLPPPLPVYSSVLKSDRRSPRIQANPSPSAHRARATIRPGLTA